MIVDTEEQVKNHETRISNLEGVHIVGVFLVVGIALVWGISKMKGGKDADVSSAIPDATPSVPAPAPPVTV